MKLTKKQLEEMVRNVAAETDFAPAKSGISSQLNHVKDIQKLLDLVGFTITVKDLWTQLQTMPPQNKKRFLAKLAQIAKLTEDLMELLP